jgi:hypothetical protein
LGSASGEFGAFTFAFRRRQYAPPKRAAIPDIRRLDGSGAEDVDTVNELAHSADEYAVVFRRVQLEALARFVRIVDGVPESGPL